MKSFFRRAKPEPRASVELQGLIYAIGDVHGRLDLLTDAFSRIEAHAAGETAHLLLLGDYVDRGPDSRGVVDFLMQAQQRGNVTCLKGNHEQMMVQAVRSGGSALSLWLGNGGVEALRSYGILQSTDLWAAPPEHIGWMEGLPLLARDPHRVYVHAGLAPGVPLEQQPEETCLWIREKFLRAEAEAFPAHVVHGHTPHWAGKKDPRRPELLPHRTNLDTGAYYTDVLTVGVFRSDRPGGPSEVLTVQAPG